MTDSSLNSVHLPPARREHFRSARQALLQARGVFTERLEAGAMTGPDGTVHGGSDPSEAGAVPAVRLALVDADHVYPLKVGVNTLGRFPDNDVVVDSPHISRRQCAILVHAERGCEIHDTASRNGTFLNGRRLQGPTRLRPGDEIQMSGRRLVLVRADEVPARPGPA